MPELLQHLRRAAQCLCHHCVGKTSCEAKIRYLQYRYTNGMTAFRFVAVALGCQEEVLVTRLSENAEIVRPRDEPEA